MLTSLIFSLLLTLMGVFAAPSAELDKRSVINHDAVQGFPQTVPNNAQGRNYLRFKPFLYVINGCVPFPAVDKDGNTGGGLQNTGDSHGHCSKSTGQVYVRSGVHNGRAAIMYSWYFPKDEPSSGIGHRHDWESVVVWVDSLTAGAPRINAVSASAHGGFDAKTSGYSLSGTRPLIKYESTYPLDHQLGFTNQKGGEQPLIAWESLTPAARTALTNTDFGKANVPFKDSNFQNNLGKAAY